MPHKPVRIDRRAFLKVGGVGLGGLSALQWADVLAKGDDSQRMGPAEPVVLRSREMEVWLDRHDALPYEYRLLALNSRMHGEDSGSQIDVTICRRNPWGFSKKPTTASSVQATETQADFQFHATYEGMPAVSFMVRYALDGATVYVSLEDVKESEGYELIEIGMPRLATVREEDGLAWLAHGNDGGSLVNLSEAKPGNLPEDTWWGKVCATLPVVMIGIDRAICVLEVSAYMDATELAVAGESGHRRAALGTIKTYRVNGSACWDLNTGPPRGPRVCGNEKTPNLLVGQRSLCRLDFLGDLDGNGSVDWLDGAKLVRKLMPEIPTHYYDDKFLYIIAGMFPPAPEPRTDFQQANKLIHDVAALTDNHPQVVYIGGWTDRGQDSDYPSEAKVNEKLGGYDGLMRLMQEARQVNCVVSLDTNYDDAYRSSPAWNPDFIARRPDGELYESRRWTVEPSYIIGLAKYMKGPGPERVKFSCEHYKLRDTILIDVLSFFPIRNDWDPAHPASGYKNLVDGRYKVLEAFAKEGIDVISEALRYAYIGKMSQTATGPTGGRCPFGGKPIPLLPTIYRHSAIWGGMSWKYPRSVLNSLFYDGRACDWFENSTDRTTITDFFYLTVVPWFKVHNREVESYHRQGEQTTIGLGGDSSIWIDWENERYSVRIEGVEIARDGSTFCQLEEDRIAFYSASAGNLSTPFPKNWDAAKVAAFALAVEKPDELSPRVEDGKLNIFVPAHRPVMVYRDGERARHRLLQV
jgi:hypothetical protein